MITSNSFDLGHHLFIILFTTPHFLKFILYVYVILIQLLLKYEYFSGKITKLKLVLAVRTCLVMHVLFDSSILILGHLLVQLHALTVWLAFEHLKPHSLEQLLNVGWNSLWHFFPFTGANSHHSRHIVSKNLGMVHDSWISTISCSNTMYSVWNLCAVNYNEIVYIYTVKLN